MTLTFATLPLRALCERREVSDRKLGSDLGEIFRRRLADILAAEAASDLPAALGFRLDETTKEVILEVTRGLQLRFGISHSPIPERRNNTVDWTRVTRLKVLEMDRPDE